MNEYEGPARFGSDALLRPTRPERPWAKIRSAESGRVFGGLVKAVHDDGNPNHVRTATILLGDFFEVTGEVLALGVLHQFGPLTAQEREERGFDALPMRARKSINGEPLVNGMAW